MPKVISALTARTQFGQIMRRAKQRGERFVVDRRGEPQVVIMGIKDFIKAISPEPKILRVIGEQSKRKGTNKITLHEIDVEIKEYRREKRLKNAAAQTGA